MSGRAPGGARIAALSAVVTLLALGVVAGVLGFAWVLFR